MKLLIVGSLSGHIGAAGKIALARGAKVSHVTDVEAALDAVRSGQGGELIMVDVTLDIQTLVESLQRERIAVPVVACGIGTDADTAVRAIRAGAKEFIPLPPDAELISAVLEAVAEESDSVLSRDPAMASVLRLAAQVAPSDATVLLTGESGTGKEVMARHIHSHSKRAKKVFVSVNCAAIPDNLLESELFGHERGAFTGAVARRIGKFEEASGGTLLLDEISEMDSRLQAKLLRAIQEKEIDRLGGTQPVKVDIRLIATSNRDLEQAVRDGSFREDLYYRLSVVNITLPPLRQRAKDIPLLAEHFLERYSRANGVANRPLDPAALDKLMHHSWRGNVRELENTMHRAVLLAEGDTIDPAAVQLSSMLLEPGRDDGTVGAHSDGAEEAAGSEASDDGEVAGLVGRTVAAVERDLIIETLSHCLGNRTHAATILGISIRTLRNKLKAYSADGVRVPAPGDSDRLMA